MGALAVILAAVSYAFVPVFMKTLFGVGMAGPQLILWRYGLAGAIVWAVVILTRRGAPRASVGRLLFLGVLMGIASLAAAFGLERLSAGVYVVVLYTYPTMVALINAAMGVRLSRAGWLALALTSVGIFLTAQIGGDLGAEALWGLGAALLNAVALAVYYVLNVRWLKAGDGLRTTSWIITGAVAIALLTAGATGDVRPPSDSAAIGGIAGIVIVSTVLPIALLTFGIERIGSNRAAILGTIEPPLAALIAWAALGETLTLAQLVGGALILTSVVLLEVGGRRRAPIPAQV